MRVLVTGALGFTGQAVTRRLLADGHAVVALTSRDPAGLDAGELPPGAEPAVADLRDAAAVEAVVADGGFDGVCHLAALTRVRDSAADPVRYFDVNVTGTLNLLRALEAATSRSRLTSSRMIFCSTAAVHGRREGRLAETDPVAPASPYGASKLAAEQVIAHLAATGRLAAVTLRCFNIAGAVDGRGDRDLTRIIPKTLAVAAGQEDVLQMNGDGGAVREYTHVRDVAAAFALALRAARPGAMPVYNVGSGRGATLAEVVATTERVTGRPVAVEHRPPQPEAQMLLADGRRIRAGLGWVPEHSSLEEIVRDGWDARHRE